MASTPDKPAGEIKGKYREALERKRSQNAAGQGDADGRDPSKVHGEHGVARSKRTFRRKSG
jgi:Family of unknown function (DUF5302)